MYFLNMLDSDHHWYVIFTFWQLLAIVILTGSGPFPGVIYMYGGLPGIYEDTTALLASHGFAALTLPFYEYDDLPKDRDIDLTYFKVSISK